MKHVASRGGRTKSALWTILGILAELMLTARLYSRKAPRKANSSPKSTYRDSAANGSATWWKART